MNKAFLFDMDGVLVDSENTWGVEEPKFLIDIFGADIAGKIGNTTGVSPNHVHETAIRHGASINREEYLRKFDDKVAGIYARVGVSENVSALVDYLLLHNFRLGLVTASRYKSIEQVLSKFSFRDRFEAIVSINDENLPSKPAPDGFLMALEKLKADPKKSIVLEDSNRGIESGKAAGCYVIGYRGLLVPNYEQTGADAYANTMEDVIKLVEEFTRR